jgi:nitrogen-specific signal transduction histidine kinase
VRQLAGAEIDFFWMVVYELRQPLTTITGDIQLAKKSLKADPERALRTLEHATTQISRIDRLLVELHDRARKEVEARAV